MDFIDQEIASAPAEHAELLRELKSLFQRKLWHQLSQKLMETVNIAYFQSQNRLLNFYQKFLNLFEKKIKPLVLVQLARHASQQAADSVAFLEGVLKTVAEDKEAALLCSLRITLIKIQAGQLEESKTLLSDAKSTLEAYPGVMDRIVHSTYHDAAMHYHKVKGTAAEFFDHSIQYLSYTPLEAIPPAQQRVLAADVGLAAILGTKVYNFGELLQHDVVNALKGTDKQWLYDLLFAFNGGDINGYQTIAESKAADRNALHQNQIFLAQKIRIMALMDMTLSRSSHDRVLSFADISAHCQLPVPQVELLLMKAFSIGVMKGIIDQVDDTVQIKWVQPRVLDSRQLGQLKTRMEQWAGKVKQVTQLVEQNAREVVQGTSA